MAYTATSMEYHKIWLADFFHGFPHLDLSFVGVNSTFNPENAGYRESLGFWGGIPMLICALLWLLFLIFFCLRCCRKSQRKQSSTTYSRFCLGLFLLLGCGALATAFYGNSQVHDGMDNFVRVVKVTNRTVRDAMQVLTVLDRTANNTEKRGVPSLLLALDSITNVTERTRIGEIVKQIGSKLEEGRTEINTIRGDASEVNTEEITDQAEEIEYYRWVTTILVYCVYVTIIFFTFTGLLKKSRWILIVVSVVSLVFMVVIWGFTSTYLAISVGSGDLCVDPDTFVMSRVNGTVKGDILTAYIKCTDSSQPYQEQILDAQTKVTEAITALNKTVNMSLPFNISDKLTGPVSMIRSDLKFVFGNLSSISTLVGSCDTLHGEYISGVRALCSTTLYGLGYLVLFSALIGLCSAVMIFCAALAWPYLHKRRRGREGCRSYAPVDDTDPFLPDPPPYQQQNYGTIASTDRPERASAINTNEETRPSIIGAPEGDSPPPAYHPGHFMQQYYNLAPRPTSIIQSSQSTT
ncbi:protein tweety homolog 1-B-like isoform X2 [Littorina saxatilis]|uniref:Protein tweety homolog n=1 Tax=Littorina saxatilis TaxID=31220 RepID=A0AAN9BYA1_9CAEN